MQKIHKIIFLVLLAVLVALLAAIYYFTPNPAVLNPKGIIGYKEMRLIVISTLLMLTVVIPVFVISLIFAWKYRASNKKAKYSPNWDNSLLAESIWWGLPCIIIVILGVITWKSSHDLDPFKPLDSNKKPIVIQVVALQWKWLFIYPEQKIATVNYVQFPAQTPLNFQITADAPMNAFWIPRLGGQIYAMPGMTTKLHLMADEVGSYRGSSANLSGSGFAAMHFKANSLTQEDFDSWVESVKQTANPLTQADYTKLVEPSIDTPPAAYTLSEDKLFEQIVMKYMMPAPQMQDMNK